MFPSKSLNKRKLSILKNTKTHMNEHFLNQIVLIGL